MQSSSTNNDTSGEGKGQAPFSAEVEVIHERGYRSVLGKTPLKEAGFKSYQQRAPGILIPLHGVDGSIIGHQYRPDKPREDTKRGRVIKYENPLGSSIRLDVSPCLGQLVELDVPLRRYRLPLETVTDINEAVKTSLDFLNIGEARITIPLWSTMHLAPLSEVLDPAFTLWQVGPTGTFKSTIQALALSHFGMFTVRSLPASWRDTANYLEKLLALAKDIPLVIDDFAPPPDTKQARELEVKAEQ